MRNSHDYLQGIFRGSEARKRGLLTKQDLYESSYWRRLFHDVYAHPAVEIDHGKLCYAAHLMLPERAVFAGHSAAWLHGVQYRSSKDKIDVLTPEPGGYGPVKGIHITVSQFPPELIPAPGMYNRMMLSPQHTALHIARHYPLEESVPALDCVLRKLPITVSDVHSVIPVTPRAPWGYSRAQRALARVDTRSESWMESKLRVIIDEAGFSTPTPQYVVECEGNFIGRVDLAWPAQRVAVEYDGAWHAQAAQRAHDERRYRQLQQAGWHIIRVDAEKLRARSALFAEIRAVL